MSTPTASDYLQGVMAVVDQCADYKKCSREKICLALGHQLERVIVEAQQATRFEKWSIRDDKPAEFYTAEDAGGQCTFMVGMTGEGIERRFQKHNNKSAIVYIPHRMSIYFDKRKECKEFETLVKEHPEFVRARVREDQKELFDKRMLDFPRAKKIIAALFEDFSSSKTAYRLEQFDLWEAHG